LVLVCQTTPCHVPVVRNCNIHRRYKSENFRNELITYFHFTTNYIIRVYIFVDMGNNFPSSCLPTTVSSGFQPSSHIYPCLNLLVPGSLQAFGHYFCKGTCLWHLPSTSRVTPLPSKGCSSRAGIQTLLRGHTQTARLSYKNIFAFSKREGSVVPSSVEFVRNISVHGSHLCGASNSSGYRVIAQGGYSSELLTAAARVRSQFKSCGICGGKSGIGEGFLRVLWFPLPILISPISPH
jgi:hypothetical protein